MSLSKPFKVFAVVVTYNGSTWTDKCLGSLNSSFYPIKTIVVDNRSTDNTVSEIEQKFPNVDLIKNETNLGFGRANNIGIAKAVAADADFVFLLNQDAWIENDTIDKLVGAMIQHPDFGVVSPLHFDGGGQSLDFGFNQYLLREFNEDKISEFISGKAEALHELEFINAAAWLVSRNCLEHVGGFGYLFSHYGEDRDYVQRMKYHSFKIGFVTHSKIYHDRNGRHFDLTKRDKFVWYYCTGAVTRLSDISKPFWKLFIMITTWCLRDCIYYFFFKKRFFAIFAFFEIGRKILGSIKDIRKYRDQIKSNQKFIFIKEIGYHLHL